MCNPRFVVVSAIDVKAFRRHADELVALAREMRVCLGGAGAAKARVDADVVVLTGGPVDEAARLTQLMAPEWA